MRWSALATVRGQRDFPRGSRAAGLSLRRPTNFSGHARETCQDALTAEIGPLIYQHGQDGGGSQTKSANRRIVLHMLVHGLRLGTCCSAGSAGRGAFSRSLLIKIE